MVALGEPSFAFRITTLPSERQQSAVDAALELLPPPSVRTALFCCLIVAGWTYELASQERSIRQSDSH